MHQLTFYPIGNGDCCLIDLECEQKLLFDFADLRNPNDSDDLRIDLETAIRDNLHAAKQTYFDVVAFTHADDDHIHNATNVFALQHAQKYQGPDRIEIRELWVPAALIVEDELTGEARILQAEARHRLREGKGIRVFSRPERLKDWLNQEGLTLADRQHLITDAGQTIPGYTTSDQGVEFFVHSPFASRHDEGLDDRNGCSLVLQATFASGGAETRLMMSADTVADVLDDMVRVTRYHNNDARLAWDIFKLPHHCSYLSLNDERGTDVTEPLPRIDWLFHQGAQGGIIISTSWPIPSGDADSQPPHRQAANYYKQRVAEMRGEFKVTMAHPTTSRPEPLIITINRWGATIKKTITSGSTAVTSRPAPRAG